MNSDAYHSRAVPKEDCFVWIWLPGEAEPVVAGKVQREKSATESYAFAYGAAYRSDKKSISIYDGDLPLRKGAFRPPADHSLASSLRDALPDNWGRRVIVNNLTGYKGRDIKEDAFDEMTFMLASGSDRIGALDFQESSSVYKPRGNDEVTLEDLLTFADFVQAGKSVPAELDKVILHGSSIGGARPKALITDAGGGTGRPRKMIAKFSSTNDPFGMVKGEFATMRMAANAGLNVAPVEITQTLGRNVLLVERFDRHLLPCGNWGRKAMVSALTWTQENELGSRHVAYTELADIMREQFSDPERNLREMFSRLTFNILCGNTDDHCRNHAAFWDGRSLTLTPAYDIAPQARGNYEARQAIGVTPGNNDSMLTNALQAAPAFMISESEARKIIDEQVEIIAESWPHVSEEAGMTPDEALYFENRQILPQYAFDGYGPCPDLRPAQREGMPSPNPF